MNYLIIFILFHFSNAFVNFGFMHSTEKNFFSGANPNNLENKKYPISKGKKHYIENQNQNQQQNIENAIKYPLSRKYYEESLKRLNSKNITVRESEMFKSDDNDDDPEIFTLEDVFNQTTERPIAKGRPGIRIIINKGALNAMSNQFTNMFTNDNEDNDEDGDQDPFSRRFSQNRDKKSENFEVITKAPLKFITDCP